ncbi:MAG: hypothetical protein CM15mP62_18920 [Rhodospirillaceae bacterium]|nr:MAG: hypothetical protein CM15mP62_18920 [Rhodospirillaceae bacterium]
MLPVFREGHSIFNMIRTGGANPSRQRETKWNQNFLFNQVFPTFLYFGGGGHLIFPSNQGPCSYVVWMFKTQKDGVQHVKFKNAENPTPGIVGGFSQTLRDDFILNGQGEGTRSLAY